MHRKSWHSQFCKYDVWNLRPLKTTNQQSWSYHMNCCLSRRGKTVRSTYIKDIHKDPPSESALYQGRNIWFHAARPRPQQLVKADKGPIFFGGAFLQENKTMSEMLKIFKQHILSVGNLIFGIISYKHCLNSTFDACPKVFFLTVWKQRRKMAVKVRRVYAFFDGLKFQQNDRC